MHTVPLEGILINTQGVIRINTVSKKVGQKFATPKRHINTP